MQKGLFAFLFLAGASGFGILYNIYLGLFLSRNSAAASDTHLTVALISVGILIFSHLGLIRTSKKPLAVKEKSLLLTKTQTPVQNIQALQTSREKAVSCSILILLGCIISLISGTVSQTGRFPLVHGIFGFALAGLTMAALWFWVKFLNQIGK